MNKQKQQRRDEFINAARELINTQGYDACTIRAICQQVGVASSSFYNCFADKDEVLFCIGGQIDTHFEEIEDLFTHSDPRENLRFFIGEYLSWIEAAGYECCWRIHISQRAGSGMHYDALENRSLVRIVNRIFYQGRELWYGDLNETEMFDLLMSTLRGMTFEWAQKKAAWSLSARGEKECNAIVRMLFRP